MVVNIEAITTYRETSMSTENNLEKISSLSCWNGRPAIEKLSGGITNQNFKVSDDQGEYVVRLGSDIYEHLILRSNEMAASQAAFEIGLSPRIVYSEPGVLVLEFIEGKVYSSEDVKNETNLSRILVLLKRFHREMPKQFKGYPVMFWVFQVIQHYEHVLRVGRSEHFHRLPGLLQIAHELQNDVGPVEIVYGHNDLLPANFIDDGRKIWLIDFDYAGFNSPLFDLANLASNNGLSLEQEQMLLDNYYETEFTDARWKAFQAMKCASLLRETMWSMVSEIHSEIDFDYAQYTQENLDNFQQAYDAYRLQMDA